jgi:hypothetical protein
VTRNLTGKIKVVHHHDVHSELCLINTQGIQSTKYFYHNEEVLLAEEPENFEQCIKEYEKFERVRGLYKKGVCLGADPEMFVVDKKNEVIPSFEFLKSKQENELTLKPQDCIKSSVFVTPQTIFWDGFQAEFNVCSSGCLAWVCDSTFVGLKTLQQKARAYNKDARLTIQSTLQVSPLVLQDAKKEHIEFGCMPSFNIYGMEGIKKDGRQVPYRSAGGHIHFGLGDREKKNKELIERYVKTLDKILGVACVSLFANYDKPERRKMYGLAGEYRLPKHGLEYRTLSSAWLASPLIMNMVFELARMTLSVVDGGLENLWNSTEEETIKCINTCDVDLAREILARNKAFFISMQYAITGGRHDDELPLNLYKIFMLGLDSILENPDDIEKNWGLNGRFTAHCEGDGMTIGKIFSSKYKDLGKEKVTEIYEELVKQINEPEEVQVKPAKRA